MLVRSVADLSLLSAVFICSSMVHLHWEWRGQDEGEAASILRMVCFWLIGGECAR